MVPKHNLNVITILQQFLKKHNPNEYKFWPKRPKIFDINDWGPIFCSFLIAMSVGQFSWSVSTSFFRTISLKLGMEKM